MSTCIVTDDLWAAIKAFGSMITFSLYDYNLVLFLGPRDYILYFNHCNTRSLIVNRNSHLWISFLIIWPQIFRSVSRPKIRWKKVKEPSDQRKRSTSIVMIWSQYVLSWIMKTKLHPKMVMQKLKKLSNCVKAVVGMINIQELVIWVVQRIGELLPAIFQYRLDIWSPEQDTTYQVSTY